MNRIIINRLLSRQFAMNNQQVHSSVRLLNKDESSSSDSSDSSDSDSDTSKVKPVTKFVSEKTKTSKEATTGLLNNLLMQMSQPKPKTETIDRAIPKKKILPKPVREPTLEEKMITAAKDVAGTLGGDVEQTEVELLNKIFSTSPSTPKSTPESSTPGSTTSASTSESTQTKQPMSSLSDLLAGMNIDKAKKKDDSSDSYTLNPLRTERVREMARKFRNINISPATMDRARSRVYLKPANLYSGPRLNIFEPDTDTADDIPRLETWEKIEQEELEALLAHPPENIYQEMIQWTERGILWKFPIDNEIGMDEEANVHFSEHVFMDRHLKDWCPKKGPIRHFMELVCVGLSKNPYLTVQEKKDHIKWYQDFFSSKQQLLKDVGAIENDIPPSNSTKEIES